jgi:hypothetical protein
MRMIRTMGVFVALTLFAAGSAFARQTQEFKKGWIDVNFGAAVSGSDAEVFTFTDTVFSETLGLAAAYPEPSRGAEFDFGGGFMFSRVVGLGLSFSGTAHEDTAGLGATVPHPFFFNASSTAADITDNKLSRTEGAVNMQATVVALDSDRFRVRFFGGPSYFRYKADMVRDIDVDQAAFAFSRVNLVSITGYERVEAEGTGWGYHAGADLGYFFSRVVGIGGFLRYSGGHVTLDPEPMSEVSQEIKVGGVQGGGGLRLRF